MHIPDGFLDAPTSVGAGIVAVGGVAVSLRQAGKDSLESRAPMTGLVAAFLFSAQMLNFPVAAGTSGHLLGGLLAAVLVGPWLGSLALTVVLVVQCLLFADGGISALGLNIINMAFVPTFAGYGLFWLIRRVLPDSVRGVIAAATTAAFVSVVLASLAFTLEYAIGGNGAVSVQTAAGAMVSVHLIIGIGEAIITGLAVAAIVGTRPDLVFGARDLPPTAVPVPAGRDVTVRTRWFVVIGLAVALILAFGVSRYASSKPDGLEKVASDNQIDTDVDAHALADGPIADYRARGVDDPGLATGLAGVIGVFATFAIAGGAVWIVSHRTSSRDD